MSIDTYAPCPGGTGKKIKFCCADLVGDLEQLDRLVEGDQLSAALDQVKRLQEKTPGRACLMATRTKLEFASKRYADAAASSQAFLAAFPENPLALGHAAISDAIAGRIQEAAVSFDKAREFAAASGNEAAEELVRIAGTLVQAAAQLGHVGFAQGIVDWLAETGLGSEDDRRLLASIVASSGVPPALRTRVPLESTTDEAHWHFDFFTALGHARAWRLSKALTAFRSLKGVAAESRELFTNIAVVCEMLAKPFEAAEAWLTVARLSTTSADDAVESVGRAMALETEADPDRSPQIRFATRTAVLSIPPGEEGSVAFDLLEDKLRHDGCFEHAAFDRGQWVSRNAAPPRSAWRVYDQSTPARLLATLLLFGRQTDREPEAILQGFGPDVDDAAAPAEAVIGCTFAAAVTGDSMPAVTPTNWLLGSQFRLVPPTTAQATPPGQPSAFDTLMAEQRQALWNRFIATWPDTPLPELLGQSPREAVAAPESARRVEALVREGEATSRRADAAAAWTAIRSRIGLPAPVAIDVSKPLEEGLPPMRWHRLDMARLSLEELRGILIVSGDAGFDAAASKAAEAMAARADATPADRWEALGMLEAKAESSVRKLELIAELRGLAKTLKVNDGMLDIAELRARMQRGDEADVMRLFEHIRREHSRDQQVIQAFAEVLMEAGVDLSALAGQAARGAGPAAGAAMPSAPASEAGGIWTPGASAAPASGGEKKVIWTPE